MSPMLRPDVLAAVRHEAQGGRKVQVGEDEGEGLKACVQVRVGVSCVCIFLMS